MKYPLYVVSVFALTFGALAIYLGTARTNYRKAFRK